MESEIWRLLAHFHPWLPTPGIWKFLEFESEAMEGQDLGDLSRAF